MVLVARLPRQGPAAGRRRRPRRRRGGGRRWGSGCGGGGRRRGTASAVGGRCRLDCGLCLGLGLAASSWVGGGQRGRGFGRRRARRRRRRCARLLTHQRSSRGLGSALFAGALCRGGGRCCRSCGRHRRGRRRRGRRRRGRCGGAARLEAGALRRRRLALWPGREFKRVGQRVRQPLQRGERALQQPVARGARRGCGGGEPDGVVWAAALGGRRGPWADCGARRGTRLAQRRPPAAWRSAPAHAPTPCAAAAHGTAARARAGRGCQPARRRAWRRPLRPPRRHPRQPARRLPRCRAAAAAPPHPAPSFWGPQRPRAAARGECGRRRDDQWGGGGGEGRFGKLGDADHVPARAAIQRRPPASRRGTAAARPPHAGACTAGRRARNRGRAPLPSAPPPPLPPAGRCAGLGAYSGRLWGSGWKGRGQCVKGALRGLCSAAVVCTPNFGRRGCGGWGFDGVL
jgi:hypothetical protein